MRIAIGGIQTESSTYSRIRSRTADFRILRGEQILADEYFRFVHEFNAELVPTFFARAVPGGPVEAETYRAFKAEFLERLSSAGSLDGLYLAMHGAMFVEGMVDAEGDWISAAREVVGEDCLICASYDLHGNMSHRIVDAIDMFTAYRTAPHIDVEATMRKGLGMLVDCLQRKVRPMIVWTAIPVLMPGERSSTLDEPAKSLYAQLAVSNAKPGVLDASLLVGYVWADEPRAMASAVLTGMAGRGLSEEARRLGGLYWEARERFQFGVKTGPLDECLTWAREAATRPVILADSGDNPTGGGVGDRAEVLQALLERGFNDTLVAGIADPPATEACFRAGVGRKILLQIGSALDPQGGTPVQCEVEVVRLEDRQAVVQVNGITVVLTGYRRPFHDLQHFYRLGLDPAKVKLLVVKSGYLSPELAPLANPNLMALTEGAVNQDIERLSNRRRQRTYPFDKSFQFRPGNYHKE